ncbi:hypothetical protein UlMin_013664 [Ulmus minor]
MGGAIFDIERFDGNGDYFLWKQKLKAILMQQKVDLALEEKPEFPATMTTYEKNEIFKTAYSSIFLHLSDNVLRQVSSYTTAATMWKKLDELYLVRSLPNKIYLLEQFFGFKMDHTKTLEQNLDCFNKLVLDLGNSGKKFDDEDIAVLLLNSLPESFNDVRTAIKYGRDTLTVNPEKIRTLNYDCCH